MANDDNDSLFDRARSFVARLGPGQDGNPSVQARDEDPHTVGREEFREEADELDIGRFVREYNRNPLIRVPIQNFASDVTEPGVSVAVDTDEDADVPTVPDSAPDEYAGRDLDDALEAWLSQCYIDGWSYHGDIGALLENVIKDRRGRRGTAIIEHVYDDARERERLMKLRPIRVETVTAYTREGKRIVLRGDDDAGSFDTIAVSDYGDPVRDIAPKTPAGQTAAIAQFDDIFGGGNAERDEIPFAYGDISFSAYDSDTGVLFGRPDSATILNRARSLRKKLRHVDQSVTNTAFGNILAQVETQQREVVESVRDNLDVNIKDRGVRDENPQTVSATNAEIDVHEIDASVPDVADIIQQEIEFILTAMPTPLYRVGFAGDINRDVTSEQGEDYRDSVKRERRRLEDDFRRMLRLKAKGLLLGNPHTDESLNVDVALRIRPSTSESPLRDEEFDASEFSNLMSGLSTAAGPKGGATAILSKEVIIDTVLDMDSEAMLDDDAPPGDNAPAMPAQNSEVQAAFDEFTNADLATGPFSDIPVLPDDLETLTEAWVNRWAEWIAAGRPEIPDEAKLVKPRLFAELDFNPAAHPRDPDTGQFVERPFDIPTDAPNFSDMSTKETLSYIDENGGDVAGTVFDPGTPVTVDGVPNDATSLDDIDDDGGSSTRNLANRAAEIRDSDAAGFKRRDEIESLIEEETGVTARFDDFTPEQAAAAAAGVSAVVEREGSLPDHLEKFRAGISSDVTDDLGGKPLGIHRMINNVGVIELDPEQFDAETMKTLNDDGFLVGDSARDAMIHELGHAVHRERDLNGSGDGYFGRSMPMDASTKESIRDNISDYAAENVKEFVAEGYTARIIGVDIEDDDVNIAGLLDHFLGED